MVNNDGIYCSCTPSHNLVKFNGEMFKPFYAKV